MHYPQDQEQVLAYLKVLKDGGAGRTSYSSALTALRFVEEAGEVPFEERLNRTPAVDNFKKEAALVAETTGEKPAQAGQAPALPLKVVSALEAVVNNTDLPRYHRAYAWFTLLRQWTAMRWDDTQALLPYSLERRARGVWGLLERTKTSGPGKNMGVLPVFVSDQAYLVEPWLDAGLTLWLEEDMHFVRDYFLPLPSVDLQGVVRTKAAYSDAAAFHRSVLAALVDTDGSALLLPGAVAFWQRLHGERAGLSSWCATLGVGESDRGFLGRWAARGNQDVYVRTATRVCENLQNLAARYGRRSLAGGPDYYGEEHLLAQLRAHLVETGISKDDAQVQVSKLLFADCSLDPTLRVSALKAESRELVAEPLDYRGGRESDSEAGADEEADASETDLESECLPFAFAPPPPPSAPPLEVVAAPVADDEQDDQPQDGIPTPTGEAERGWREDVRFGGNIPTPTGEAEAGEFDLAVALAEAPPMPGHGWVVSKCRSARKLHFVGMCFRVPGRHYRQFDTFGDVMPDETEIDSRCKDCFAALGPAGVPVADSDEEASTVSSSSSSSSEDDAPPVKARRR